MTWEERRAWARRAPEAGGLARMAEDVAGPGAAVRRVVRLRGGVDCSTHAVLLAPGGWVVVKRGWSPDGRSLEAEHERLAFARRAPVPRWIHYWQDGYRELGV